MVKKNIESNNLYLSVVAVVAIVAIVAMIMLVGGGQGKILNPITNDLVTENLGGQAMRVSESVISKQGGQIVEAACMCSGGGNSWPGDPTCTDGCMECCIMVGAQDGTWVDF